MLSAGMCAPIYLFRDSEILSCSSRAAALHCQTCGLACGVWAWEPVTFNMYVPRFNRMCHRACALSI